MCRNENFLPFLDEMRFVAAGPMETVPKFFAELASPSRISPIFIHRRFFSCLHVAVGRHHRRRIPRHPRGLQLSRVQVSLADHMHSRSGIHHKLSFFGVYSGCGRFYPLLRRSIECSFVFSFELACFWQGSKPCLGASLLSCSLSGRSLLKFHCVGTSLMRNFDLSFTKRWSFIFSDVCLTHCSSRELYSSSWSQHFCALPRNRCRIWRLSVL